MTPDWYVRPSARHWVDPSPSPPAVRDFHRSLPDYAPTPLVDLPALADELGVGSVWVKDESSRLGLPAFKILGASWASARAVAERTRAANRTGASALDLDMLRTAAAGSGLRLVTATDGNHGRAVARIARWLGLDAEIFVPGDMSTARREAIASEGATVTVVDGTYDDAVARAASLASERCLVIADTALRPDEEVPSWVIDGYSTILWEVEDELERLGEEGPDVVAVQMGVGAFAAAVTRHFRRPGLDQRPFLLGVEPLEAACVLRSIEAGEPVVVPGPHRSIMAGLNCGAPSPVAWPVLKAGIDQFVAVDDEWARRAMRLLARSGVVAGESGAAGLAGLLALRAEPEAPGNRLRLNGSSRILIFNTEGATDPEAYRQIVGEQ